MNAFLNAVVAAERRQQLIADAAEFRRSRIDRKGRVIRRRARSRRVSALQKDFAAASL